MFCCSCIGGLFLNELAMVRATIAVWTAILHLPNLRARGGTRFGDEGNLDLYYAVERSLRASKTPHLWKLSRCTSRHPSGSLVALATGKPSASVKVAFERLRRLSSSCPTSKTSPSSEVFQFASGFGAIVQSI